MMPSIIQRATSFDPTVAKSSKHTIQRRTSFATISVREYEQTIGDSPSCFDGAPVTLGWAFRDSQVVPFEEYEQARQPFRRRRSDLILGVQERRKKLVESGVSISDVLRAEKLTNLRRSDSQKETNGKDLGKGFKKNFKLHSLKEIHHTQTQVNQKQPKRHTSQPLKKQIVSRAA